MEVCRPYIIFLTESQENDLQKHFKINSWKVNVFKCIHSDLQFLVDILIQGNELDISSLKDSVLHSKRKSSRRSKLETNGLKLERQKHANSHLSCQELKKVEECFVKEKEKALERKMEKQQLEGNVGKDTVKDASEDENLKEEAQNIESLLEDTEERTVEANCQSNFGDKVSTSKVPLRKRKHRYKKHVSEGSKISRLSCEICGKVSASERYLQRHMEKLHSEEAKKRKEEERRRKQDEEINVCHICKKQFAHKYALTAHHLNIHSGKKEVFQCDLCGAVVKHKGSLVQHKKSVHSNKRPHKCEICGSQFKLYQQLKTHKRRHDPDFVETCTICGKTLKKGHLTTHMKRHTNERKYRCDKCSKKFYEKQDLERHVILHSGEKPNKCPHCSYACAFKGNLTKHIKVRHETDLDLAELQNNRSDVRLKSSHRVNNKSQSIKVFPAENQSNVGTYINDQAQISRMEAEQFSPVQYVTRGISENIWSRNGNKKIQEDTNYQNDYEENFKGHNVSSVQEFSGTDSQGDSLTSPSQLHTLRPVQHMNEPIVGNFAVLDQDANSSNFIDLRGSYLLNMPSNESD